MKIQENITSLDDDIDSLMITANVLLKIHTASIIKLVLADKSTEPNLHFRQYQLETTISKGNLACVTAVVFKISNYRIIILACRKRKKLK